MHTAEARVLIRKLITDTDHLSRTSYAAARDVRSWRFAALRSTLLRLERGLGREPPQFTVAGEFDVVYQRVVAMAAMSAPEEKDELDHMVADAGLLRSGVAEVDTLAR